MRDWSKEPWHKVFQREDGAWLAMSWQARGLYRLLQSEAGRDGVIKLGKFSGHGFRWVAVVFRMRDDEAHGVCDELEADGFIVVQPDGSWLLPHHADQQATISSSTERVKRHRDKQRSQQQPETEQSLPVTLQPLHVTVSDVAVERKERKEREEINKEKKDTLAGARTRSNDDAIQDGADPKALWIWNCLKAVPKFSSLPSQAAEELLGSLGPLGLSMTEDHVKAAIAEAQAMTETGATEAAIRRTLHWKLKDAVSGKRKQGLPKVQGADSLQQDIERLRQDRARAGQAGGNKDGMTF